MAVRIDASGDSMTRTTGLPPVATFTMMAWIYRPSARNTWSAALHFGSSNFYGLYPESDTDVLTVWNGTATTKGSAVSLTTWHHIALVVAGTGASQGTAYLNGVLDITFNGNASNPGGLLTIGNDPSVEWFNGRVAAIKIYDVALTVDEIRQEMVTILPQRLANLNSFYPCFPGAGERAADYSGNGRAWTENGTLTDEDPPPISWGSPGIELLTVTAAAGINGTAALTEGADTLASVSALALSGSLAATEAADTLASAGALALSGTLAKTEAADTLSATGALAISGTASLTNSPDTLSSAGALALNATAALTEGADTLSSAGALALTGTLARTEAADTLTSTGTLVAVGSGTLAVTEGADTLSSAGTLALSGLLSATEAGDSISASGVVALTGALFVTEAGDSISAAGALGIVGLFAATLGADTLTAAGMEGGLDPIVLSPTRAYLTTDGQTTAILAHDGRTTVA